MKPYASLRMVKKDAHQPPQTPRGKPATKSLTPPPPPKKITPPKRSSPKDLENFKELEAEKQHAQMIEDLQMSSESSGKDENDENDVGDCIGRNRIFPAKEP